MQLPEPFLGPATGSRHRRECQIHEWDVLSVLEAPREATSCELLDIGGLQLFVLTTRSLGAAVVERCSERTSAVTFAGEHGPILGVAISVRYPSVEDQESGEHLRSRPVTATGAWRTKSSAQDRLNVVEVVTDPIARPTGASTGDVAGNVGEQGVPRVYGPPGGCDVRGNDAADVSASSQLDPSRRKTEEASQLGRRLLCVVVMATIRGLLDGQYCAARDETHHGWILRLPTVAVLLWVSHCSGEHWAAAVKRTTGQNRAQAAAGNLGT